MEGARDLSSSDGGVTVVGSDAPSDYHIAPRSESSDPAPAPAPTLAPFGGIGSSDKKRRGRPRKYGPDGTVVALSPRPISSAAPSNVIDFSVGKRGKLKPASSFGKPKFGFDHFGEWAPSSVGSSFTPHVITVNSGEDVTMKVISFAQQGPKAICILSANGVISSVTLRQPDSSGGTLTYEGRFEILSLSGSFMPSESGGTRSRTGGMSVSLASADGRVVGGGVAGLLVAAGPVQVVVGSFLAGDQQDKPKKLKHDFLSTPSPTTTAVRTSSGEPRTGFQTTNLHVESWSTLPSDSRSKPSDINIPLTGS